MTNSRSTAKWAGERSCCGAATGVADRVVGIWGLVAVTLVLGLLAAAPVRALCINDGQGPDDQPGQKDVSGLCEPGPTCSSSSTTLSLLWQMDDVTWSGGNTGDACALIDLNQDGLADRAICVTTFGAAQMAGKCSNNQFLGCTKNQRPAVLHLRQRQGDPLHQLPADRVYLGMQRWRCGRGGSLQQLRDTHGDQMQRNQLPHE